MAKPKEGERACYGPCGHGVTGKGLQGPFWTGKLSGFAQKEI